MEPTHRIEYIVKQGMSKKTADVSDMTVYQLPEHIIINPHYLAGTTRDLLLSHQIYSLSVCNMTCPELIELCEKLQNKSSSKRRTAAKKLRKTKSLDAGPSLERALRKEIKDPRTWETQYQLIMALGECGYPEALPLLQEISTNPSSSTMVQIACGDAIARLAGFEISIEQWIEEENFHLFEGAVRMAAMEHVIPNAKTIDEIIIFAKKSENSSIRFWVSAAAPGWSRETVSLFLTGCLDDSFEDTRTAAKSALKGEYLKWRPL